MKDALYVGQLSHRRFSPKRNEFTYDVCYYFLDVENINLKLKYPFLFSYNFPGILSFWRKKYLGPTNLTLKEAVSDLIKIKTGKEFNGKVFIFTNLSYFGLCFNPVSFYFCYEEEKLEYIVSEITNTPWGERHANVFTVNDGENHQFSFKKDFHVSPFMPMTIDYKWIFETPGESLRIVMQNRNFGEQSVCFDSTLKVERQEFNTQNVIFAFLRFPFVTFKTVFAIYWQALKLYLKQVPFYSHPEKEKRIL